MLGQGDNPGVPGLSTSISDLPCQANLKYTPKMVSMVISIAPTPNEAILVEAPMHKIERHLVEC